MKQAMLRPAPWFATGIAIAAIHAYTHASEPPATVPTDRAAYAQIEVPGIHNAFRVSERIYSGSQPEGDAAFAALAKLGIKTLISVDGSKPDVASARKHGLRYVHLPFGYGGVPTNRVAELAKAAATQPGPLFVHCHHGLHRGPAAVAIICEATEAWTTNRAEAWMRQAGTAPDYVGLYRSATGFRKPTPEELQAVRELPEIARTSSLVEAMVAIDEHLAALRQSQKAGWKAPPDHADISPAHEATLVWEQFREITRTPDTETRQADYRAKLSEAERAADSLRRSLQGTADAAANDAAFKKLGQSCTTCHHRYRNE